MLKYRFCFALAFAAELAQFNFNNVFRAQITRPVLRFVCSFLSESFETSVPWDSVLPLCNNGLLASYFWKTN